MHIIFGTWSQSSWFPLFSTLYLVQVLTQSRFSMNARWKKWPQYQLMGNSLSFGLMGFVKGCVTIHTLITRPSNNLMSTYSVSVTVLEH